jgi:hypothetical protein
MIRLAQESSNWLLIEQKVEPDPLEMIANHLVDDDDEENKMSTSDGSSKYLVDSIRNYSGEVFLNEDLTVLTNGDATTVKHHHDFLS